MKHALQAAVTALVLLISLTGCSPKDQPHGDYPHYSTEQKLLDASVAAVHVRVLDAGTDRDLEGSRYRVQKVHVIASTSQAIAANSTISVATPPPESAETVELSLGAELVIFLGEPLAGVYQVLTPFQAVFVVKDGKLTPTGDPDIPLTTQRLGLR